MQRIRTKFKKATSTPKGRIIALVIFLLVLGGIGGGLWYWNTNKKAIIGNKLVKAIAEKSQGFYKVTYDDLQLDEIAGNLSISNMHLTHDSVMHSLASKMGGPPPVLIDIKIPEISVSGVKTPKALIENEIIGNKLVIKNPVIDISYTYKGKDSALNVPTDQVYRQILGNLDLIQIDTVLILGAQVRTINGRTGKAIVQCQDLTVDLVDVKVDSAGNADPSRLFFAKQVNIDCKKISWAAKNKLYNYTGENIIISSTSNDIRIRSFNMEPTMGEDAFVRSLPTQDDRFDARFDNILINNVNLQKLFNEQLVAETMQVSGLSFKIYRDLAIPRDKVNRVGTYPHQVMDDVPIDFNIRKMNISGAFIEYKERNHITRESGKVQFYGVNGTITNFTNDKEAIANNNVMTANINSSFLNKAPMKTNWTFYLGNQKGRFSVKGSLGAITGSQLNPLTEPMGPASITKGKVNGLDFNIQGDDYGADATVKLLYEDLKVALLEKDKGATTTDKKFLTSLLANFIINNDNPDDDGEAPKVVNVHFDRDTNRSMFHLCWKTLFKGVQETMGIKAKKI